MSCFPPQAILNNDETNHLLENLEPDTPYDVSVTAIYPDESESEDLLGTERTCKKRRLKQGPIVISISTPVARGGLGILPTRHMHTGLTKTLVLG